MMDLDEYREKLNKDPEARRKLRKLEKEYESVTSGLTPEELEKYGFTKKKGAKETGKETMNGSSDKASRVIDRMTK